MITLTENPADYNLPFPAWYENQCTMVERAASLDQGQTLFIEAPTGTGKSSSPMLVSHFRPGTTICVATRDLQEQYADSFDDVAIVWGQSHYPCVNEPRLQEFQDSYGYTPTREDCPYRKPKDCPVYDQCPYEQSKVIALRSRAKVGNYAYMYYTKWWRGDNVNDLFCDEAHRLPRVLSDLISVEVAEKTRAYYGLPQFPCISGGTRYAYKQIASWASTGAESLNPNRQKDPKRRLRMNRMKLKLKALAESLGAANPGTWYVASGLALGKLLAKPVHPGRYARKILDPDARSVTLMSATIGDPGLLAEELGLSQDFEFLTLPHIFPKEHRPVIWMSESPRIRARTTSAEYAHQANIIAKILHSHKGQRGIIHTVSWKHVKILAGLLSKNGCGDRLYIPEGERLQAIERFKQADTDLVALTPSWHEGLNFPDDEARFAVIAKCFTDDISFLGPDGEITIDTAKPGQKVFAWKDGKIIIDEVKRVISQPYEGPVWDFKSRQFDFSVTPNHDMLVSMHHRHHKWGKVEKREVRDLEGRHFRIPVAAGWEGESPPARIDIRMYMSSTARVYYDAPGVGMARKETVPSCFQYDGNNRMYRASLWDLPPDWEPLPGRRCFITERPQSGKFPWDYDFVEFMKLMGWFITEGHLFHNKHYEYENGWAGETWGIAITQNEGSSLDEIWETMNSLGLPFTIQKKSREGKSRRVVVNGRTLYRAFSEWCGHNSRTKQIPAFLLNKDKETLDILLDILIKGDGHKSKAGHWSYATVSDTLKWNMLELVYKVGYRPHATWQGYWHIGIARRQIKGTVHPRHKRKRHYKGFVWCIETESGTLLAGRNGKWAFAGNCPYLSLGDPVVKLRLHAPGGNKWYRWQAALGVVQSAGRIVRHKDDWGVTYIVDHEWGKVSRYAPAWFEFEEA